MFWVKSFFRKSFVGVHCLIVVTMFASAQGAPEGPKRDDRIGVCTHFSQNWSVEQVMPLIAKSGVGWIRDDLGWAGIEPTPGNYRIPAKAKAWIQAAQKAGLKIALILAYGNRAYPDQYDTDAYAKAAGWLAREIGNDVQAIEILNEPNNFGFRDLYGGAWNGNEPNGSVSPYLKKYVQLLNAAAKEIKRANPNISVIGLGAPPPANFRMIALGLVPEIDGLTDHPYSRSLPELVPYPANPAFLLRDGIATADLDGTFGSQVLMYRAQAKKWGATDRLWHTEWGYSTLQPKSGKPGMSEETQATYILRRILESYALGIEHSFIYDFKDDGTNPYSDYDNFGLIRNNGSPKQAYFAVQRITRLLAGTRVVDSAKEASIENDPGAGKTGLGDRCYTFSSSDKQTTVVAFWKPDSWKANGATRNVIISLPLKNQQPRRTFLCDLLSGQQTEIPWNRSEDGHIFVRVSISWAPQLLIVDSGEMSEHLESEKRWVALLDPA
jgi:hypothetical protein